MFEIKHNSGTTEFVASADEKDLHDKIKALKEKHKDDKKGSDLKDADLKDLIYAIAKHLKII